MFHNFMKKLTAIIISSWSCKKSPLSLQLKFDNQLILWENRLLLQYKTKQAVICFLNVTGKTQLHFSNRKMNI